MRNLRIRRKGISHLQMLQNLVIHSLILEVTQNIEYRLAFFTPPGRRLDLWTYRPSSTLRKASRHNPQHAWEAMAPSADRLRRPIASRHAKPPPFLSQYITECPITPLPPSPKRFLICSGFLKRASGEDTCPCEGHSLRRSSSCASNQSLN